MTDAQVTAWLRCAGLSRFAPRFAAAEISPPLFLRLSSPDLDSLGVDGPADRKRLADLIAELRRVDPKLAAASRPVLESLVHPNASVTSLPTLRSADPRPSRRPSRHIVPLASASAAASASSAPMSAASPALGAGLPRESPATVRVCVRKRPLSRKETASSDRDIVTVAPRDSSLVVHELKEKVDLTKYIEAHTFSFDNVFAEHVPNEAVYDGTARPLVDALFAGGRATCFAYGQTGAGKTFTMAGDGLENPGLYTLAVRDVFDRIRDLERDAWREAEENGDDDFDPPDPPQVWISFYEIYASRLQDLLNRGAKLECREDANSEVQIIGLSERLCEVEEDVLALVKEGSALRSTGVTGANDDSSRSHAVFQIELRYPPLEVSHVDQSSLVRESLLRGSRPNAVSYPSKGEEIGRLCFIDLAGSERGSDTASSTRQTRMEGAEINKSLLALKECIRAMDKRKDHTPFRGSKLTQVLKASFMGKNCRTVMIANISPASCNVEHTLNTLRYSDRVREIRKERGGAGSEPSHKARRATFAHGIGLRGSRAALPLPPSSSKMAPSPIVPDYDAAVDDTLRNSKVASLKSDSDIDDLGGHNGVGSRSRISSTLAGVASATGSARRTTRPSSRGSDYPLSSTFAGISSEMGVSNAPKSRDPRLMRTSKVGSGGHIPSRPSMASSMLPRAQTKLASTEHRLPRANSGLTGLPNERSMGTSDVDAAAAGLSRVTLRPGRKRDTGDEGKGKSASPAMTRQRRRELEALREEKHSDSPDSRDEESPPEETVKKPSVSAGRRRGPRASNVAESAMRYYRTKKNELAEEDLLFASSDDMADVVEEDAGKRRETSARMKKGYEDNMDSGGGIVVNVTTPSSSESETVSGAGAGSGGQGQAKISAEVKQVVRMHHMQIEELMRLTEADVTLVNEMEKGKMDAQEYALKLSLNLSQKLDIVRTLQAKVKVLE